MIPEIDLYREQTRRKLELLELTDSLEAEIRDLKQQVHRFRISAHNEQADVDNLEAPGLKSFFLGLTGKKQERLEQEQAEARSARQRLETAQIQLDSATKKLEISRQECADLGNCEESLRKLLNLPEDADTVACKRLLALIGSIRAEISVLADTLTNLSRLGSVRAATGVVSALSGTDDKIRSTERKAQAILNDLKSAVLSLHADAAAFGVAVDTFGLERFENNCLTDLYTPTLIDMRIDQITVKLRQLRLQLDAAQAKLEQISAERYSAYLRRLLHSF